MPITSSNCLKRAAFAASLAAVIAVALGAATDSASAQVAYSCPDGYHYSKGYCASDTWYAPFDAAAELVYRGRGSRSERLQGGSHGDGSRGGGQAGDGHR
jgi:hypothetical protein